MERVIRLAVRFLDDVIEMNPYPLPRDRRDGEGQPSHRPGHHGLGRPPVRSWASPTTARRPSIWPTGSCSSSRRRRTTSAASWPRSAGRSRTGTTRSIATAADAQLHGDDHRADRHDLDDRRLLVGHRADLRAGLRAPGQEPGRRAGADLRQRDVRAPGQAAGLLLGRPDGRDRHARHAARHPGLARGGHRVFKTSHEIGYEWHVRHQAAFQRPPTTACRKTINLPNDATEEDVASAYRLAWELGCLGITVFRDGCKGEQVLNVGVGDKKDRRAAASRARWSSSRGRTACRGATYRRRRRSGPPSSRSTRRRGASRSRSSCRSARAGPTPWPWPRRWGA